MKRNVILAALLAAAMLPGMSGGCFAMGGMDKESLQASKSTKQTDKDFLQQMKQREQAELRQWQNRLSQVGLAQCGSSSARMLLSYGSKPGEDPTSAMRFASAPSTYEDDVAECQMHIAMIKENLKAYEKALKDIEKAEEEEKNKNNSGGDDGGHH
ncbi:MAG: hypothetical protein J5855_05535 [Mailhella sp.]|nr:hypothetical protein [Mailhella sp.]